jgi:predicted O-methyltransferase YrrM
MTITLDPVPGGGYKAIEDPGEQCYQHGGKRISVTDEEAKILAVGLAFLHVLEIGTGLGVSTRAIEETAASVCTVDTDPWVIEHVWPDLQELGVAVTSDAPALPAQGWFNGAFIDGDHAYAAVRHDCELVIRMCEPGAVVFMHDFSGQVESAAIDAGMILRERLNTTYKLALCETPRA